MIKKPIKQLIISILIVVIAGGILVVRASTKPQLPLNARLTQAAWEAYNKKSYEQAIKKAEECIDEFQPAAIRQQRDLREENTPVPPEGSVSADKKETIINRGVLNDVATCWFIIGKSYEKIEKQQEAIQAYCMAAKFTYARTYDPSWDGFWSPSQSAMDRLDSLGGKCK